MRGGDNERLDESEADIVGLKVNVASITKFLWGIAATLAAAYIIGSISIAWKFAGDINELRNDAAGFKLACAETKQRLDGLHDDLDQYPPAQDLRDCRANVASLIYSRDVLASEVGKLREEVRRLHPYITVPQVPPASTPSP